MTIVPELLAKQYFDLAKSKYLETKQTTLSDFCEEYLTYEVCDSNGELRWVRCSSIEELHEEISRIESSVDKDMLEENHKWSVYFTQCQSILNPWRDTHKNDVEGIKKLHVEECERQSIPLNWRQFTYPRTRVDNSLGNRFPEIFAQMRA